MAVIEFLRSREIEWVHDDDVEADLGVRECILYPDGTYWKVSRIDVLYNEVTLTCRTMNATDMRPLQWCIDNKV